MARKKELTETHNIVRARVYHSLEKATLNEL